MSTHREPPHDLAQELRGGNKDGERLGNRSNINRPISTRFTYRSRVIRFFGTAYWRKGKQIYETEHQYTDEDLGNIRVVDNFLPSFEQLALKEEKARVTISLSKSSLRFFKVQADKYPTAYQRMIRNLLDAYAHQHVKQSPNQALLHTRLRRAAEGRRSVERR